jgi:hypothetical protein
MRSALQLLGGVAVAGVVATGSTAFTATGVTTNAGAAQFVGGVVSQTVSGATLSSVGYGFSDATNTSVTSVVLTFVEDVSARTVTVKTTTAGPTVSAAISCTESTTTATCSLSSLTTLTNLEITVA